LKDYIERRKTKLKSSKSMVMIAVLICITTLTAFVSIAQANDGGYGEEHFGKNEQHDFKKIAHTLELTDAQKAKAKTIFHESKEVVKPIVTSLRLEQINLRTLIHADTIDVAAIRAETAKISSIQADLNVHRANVMAKFRAILTPAQLAILKTMQKKVYHKDDTSTTTPGE
jgi:periplasmic protein CpxP/Spy